MSILILQLVQGTSRDFQLQAANPDGTPAINIFQNTDVLQTNVWSGAETRTLLSPVTTWISPPLGTFQITFLNADTANITPDTYRIQTTATRSSRSVILVDGQLQLTSAPGSLVLADLITQDYLQTNLQDSSLSESQIQLLPQLTRAASRLIRKHCNRWFNRRPSGSLTAFDGLYTLDWPSQSIVLRQFPVNGVLRARTNPTQVFNITNTSSANQQAYVSLSSTLVQDISDVPPPTTGVILNRLTSGSLVQTSIPFTANMTFQDLANAINATGNGWNAYLENSTYALWPVSDLRQGVGPSCAIGSYSQQGFWVHVDDVPIQVDQEAGIVILDAGSNDPWNSPRYGIYLDTGFGNLDVGGGFNGVRISYDAGWDTIPEDVQQSCVETIQYMLSSIKTDPLLQSESIDKYSYTIASDRFALPRSVLGKLGYYRNVKT